jgi:hypothetical protein
LPVGFSEKPEKSQSREKPEKVWWDESPIPGSTRTGNNSPQEISMSDDFSKVHPVKGVTSNSVSLADDAAHLRSDDQGIA